MAATLRTEDPRLDLARVRDRLFAEPWSFDFFQAVRLLGLMLQQRSPVGYATSPHLEVIRFGAHPSLSFPASSIHSLNADAVTSPVRMEVNFLGLIGPSGVLPQFMTELVSQRMRIGDTAVLAFFNIFNHRLTSFFYRAWERHHFTVAYERDGSDVITRLLLALLGLGSSLLQERQEIPDASLIFYSGLFAMSSRPAVGLEAILSDYFDVPVEVEPFVGVWRRLEECDQCFLEQSTDSDMLGWGAVMGDEVWDTQSRIRLRIGPLSVERYADLLPSGSAWKALGGLTKAFCGNDLEWEVQLILRSDDVPACNLGDPEAGGPALGWTTWIKSQPQFPHDAAVTVGGA